MGDKGDLFIEGVETWWAPAIPQTQELLTLLQKSQQKPSLAPAHLKSGTFLT